MEAYGRALLPSDKQQNLDSDAQRVAHEREDDGMDRSGNAGRRHGCREAVEVLTRNPKKGVRQSLPFQVVLSDTFFLGKVSYDIAKDGEQVAVLTFVKSAYRLGEAILGIVDINGPPGRTRVLKVRPLFESFSTLEYSSYCFEVFCFA